MENTVDYITLNSCASLDFVGSCFGDCLEVYSSS